MVNRKPLILSITCAIAATRKLIFRLCKHKLLLTLYVNLLPAHLALFQQSGHNNKALKNEENKILDEIEYWMSKM